MLSNIQSRRSLAVELAIVTATVLALAHLFFILRGNAVIGRFLSIITAVIFLYTPIGVLWLRRRTIDYFDRSVGAFLRSVLFFAIASAVSFPPFLLAAHGWELLVLNHKFFHVAAIPGLVSMIAFQLLLIALPEEFFFRGYFQSTINFIFPKKWRFLGADLGWGWVATALVFAFAHSVVSYQWWHFSIFFPALVFGYLRERTGSITAPIFFHAASNIVMEWIARSYG